MWYAPPNHVPNGIDDRITISLRLPEAMLAQIRLLANERDIPYLSLIKVFLQERIDEEFRS